MRQNGTERVVMFGVTLRITMTSAGFDGTSLEDILNVSVNGSVVELRSGGGAERALAEGGLLESREDGVSRKDKKQP